MNEILQFSPLIRNLFYVREFLTCNRSAACTENSNGTLVYLNKILKQEEARRISTISNLKMINEHQQLKDNSKNLEHKL